MATDVIMPKLSLTMTEGTISRWFKQEGDEVKEGEDLLEVMTDKVNMMVESPATGILTKILKHDGETAKVLEKIGIIAGAEENVEDGPEKTAAVQAPKPESINSEPLVHHSDAKETDKKNDFIKISPAARRIAREKGLSEEELKQIVPTGPGDRIVQEDVESYIKQHKEQKATPLARKIADEYGVNIQDAQIDAGQKVTKADVLKLIQKGPTADKAQVVPLSGLRKVIADRMSQSSRTTAPVTLTTEADVTDIMETYKKLKARAKEKHGVQVTFTDILALAVTKVLKRHPMINANLVEDNIVYKQEVNLGIAVAVEKGLVVPVIHDIDKKPLAEISKRRQELIDKARSGRLSAEEMTGGSFTITNLGMYDIDAFTPIINIPEAAILGIGRIVEKPAVFEGQIVIRQMMFLSLTFDHRIIDGAPAAEFLKDLKDLLQNPDELIL